MSPGETLGRLAETWSRVPLREKVFRIMVADVEQSERKRWVVSGEKIVTVESRGLETVRPLKVTASELLKRSNPEGQVSGLQAC